MFGRSHRRGLRTLWGSLTLIIAIAIGGSLYAAGRARADLTAAASRDARLVAQTQLAPMLQPKDLMGPVTGDTAQLLGERIRAEIFATTPVEKIRLYSELGRILYDADPSVVSVRPSFVRDLIYQVANGQPTSTIRDGNLLTYVPVWTDPGGTVAVAEISQPYGPISAEATGPWYRLAIGLAVAMLVTFALYVRSMRVVERELTATEVRVHPAFVAAEDARARAEQRATAAEAALKDLQAQFRTTLNELKAMEARVTMNEQQTDRSEELQALRDQLRDTAERLHKAEIDNNALRERLALRQSELEEHKARLASLEQRTPNADLQELRRRVEIAERRATEMEGEVDRVQTELDYTSNRFHMAKLSEALREIDNDADGEELTIHGDDDDLYEHPKVIFSPGRTRSTAGGAGR